MCLAPYLHIHDKFLTSIDRTQKVKDARTEAAKEIEAYKAQKAKDFKQFDAEVRHLMLTH
jgi:Vacuolar (H+)-ATPase G subunit